LRKTFVVTAQAKITSADKAVTLADLKVGEKVKVNFTEDAASSQRPRSLLYRSEKAESARTRRRKEVIPTQTYTNGESGNGFPVLLFSTICYTDRAL